MPQRPARALALQPLEAREVPSATLQLVNNSAAPALAKVDVYANNVRVANDLSYQKATAFVTAPSGAAVKLDVVAWNAASNAKPLATQTVRLTAGQAAVGVLSGDPASKAAAARFGVELMAGARTKAASPTKADVAVFNGVAAAPALDVRVERGAVLADDVAGRQFAGGGKYQSLAAADHDVEVLMGNGRTQVREFDANLSKSAGRATVLVGTGTMTNPRLLAVESTGQTALLPVAAADVAGTAGDDFFVVTSQVPGVTQVIDAYAGTVSEFLTATTPTVTIDAGGGNDGLVVYAPEVGLQSDVVFLGGAGEDWAYLIGTEAADVVTGTQVGDRVTLAASFGTLSAVGLDRLNVFGQEGDDRIDLSGVAVAAAVFGGDGNDTLTGGGGADALFGDDGDDVLVAGGGDDQLFGGSGNDRLDAGAGDDLVFGEAGDDTLIGGVGIDWLVDADGDNVFIDD